MTQLEKCNVAAYVHFGLGYRRSGWKRWSENANIGTRVRDRFEKEKHLIGRSAGNETTGPADANTNEPITKQGGVNIISHARHFFSCRRNLPSSLRGHYKCALDDKAPRNQITAINEENSLNGMPESHVVRPKGEIVR